jgi:hypothetical protein
VKLESIRPAPRKLGPVIAWAPAHEAFHLLARVLPSAGSIPPLQLTRDAILAVETHLAQGISSLPFGVLAGALCRDPATKLEYLLVDEVIPARTWLTAADPIAQLSTELESLLSGLALRRRLAIGWYIGGIGDELRLDPDTTALHRQLFPEPWQVVLLREDTADAPRCAIIRHESMTAQSYVIPFFEQMPEPASPRQAAEPPTVVRWVDYRAAEPAARVTLPEPRKQASAAKTDRAHDSRRRLVLFALAALVLLEALWAYRVLQ